MHELETRLLSGIEIAQVSTEAASSVARRAVALAGQMALQLGARVVVDEHYTVDQTFANRGKRPMAKPLEAWLAAATNRLLLIASTDEADARPALGHCSAVVVCAEQNASEASLFAESGFADLLGDPARAPLIPRGEYGAGTVAYAALSAVASLVTKQARIGQTDVAVVDAVGVLSWVNWKAAAAGSMGRDIRREGDAAEWPVIGCADGHVALVYLERDWPSIVAMVGDARLEDERFRSFRSRAAHRDEYMDVIRAWALERTKAEILDAFLAHQIPAAPVMTEQDLLSDPLLEHRGAFRQVETEGGTARSPRLAHRVAAVSDTRGERAEANGELPLSGIRVLDLGIITAGAGVSALLADLGAEVLKVESHTYPDPFRQWAGSDDSPLFKCNNRNKYGIALDLKTPDGKAQFLELVKTADVVVENFRRGVLERLGLGYEVLRARNPLVVLASVSGQGLSGPGCEMSSFGSTLEASSGFSANVSYEEGTPYITGRNINYPDQTVVLYAAAVIAAAMRFDHGMHLDVAQRDVAVYLAGERIEAVSGSQAPTTAARVATHRCADGCWIAYEAKGDAAVHVPNELESEAAVALLAANGVGASRVLLGSEMYRFMLDADGEPFAFSPDGAMVKGFPYQFRDARMAIRLNSPGVGEHTSRFC